MPSLIRFTSAFLGPVALSLAVLGCSEGSGSGSDSPTPEGSPSRPRPTPFPSKKSATPKASGTPTTPTPVPLETILPENAPVPVPPPSNVGTVGIVPVIEVPPPAFSLKNAGYGGFLTGERLAYAVISLQDAVSETDLDKALEGMKIEVNSETPEVCDASDLTRTNDRVEFSVTQKAKYGDVCRLEITASLKGRTETSALRLVTLDPERVKSSAKPRSLRFQSSGHSTDNLGRIINSSTGKPGLRCIAKSIQPTGFFSPEAMFENVRSRGGQGYRYDRALAFLRPRGDVPSPRGEKEAEEFYANVFPNPLSTRVGGILFRSTIARSRLSGGPTSLILSDAQRGACHRGYIETDYEWGYDYSILLRFHAYDPGDSETLSPETVLAESPPFLASYHKKLRGRGEVGLVVAQMGKAIPAVDSILAETTCSMADVPACVRDFKRIHSEFSSFDANPASASFKDLKASPLVVKRVGLSEGVILGFFE